jgi:plasmid stabilization system protein ParE
VNLPTVLRLEAYDDLEAAYSTYETHRAGLGRRFLAEVRTVRERIGRHPRQYGRVGHNVRAATVRRFPYVIYYKVEPVRVVILAILHGRRSPRVWKRRI